MGQVNMYLPLDQKGKQLIHTHKKFPKMVSMANIRDHLYFFFCNSWSWIDTQLLVHLLQLLLYPKLLDHFNLHLPCLNLVIRTDQIHHQCLVIQLPLLLYLPGLATLCHLSLYLKWLKVLIVSALYFPSFYFLWSLKYDNIWIMYVCRWCSIGWTSYCS